MDGAIGKLGLTRGCHQLYWNLVAALSSGCAVRANYGDLVSAPTVYAYPRLKPCYLSFRPSIPLSHFADPSNDNSTKRRGGRLLSRLLIHRGSSSAAQRDRYELNLLWFTLLTLLSPYVSRGSENTPNYALVQFRHPGPCSWKRLLAVKHRRRSVQNDTNISAHGG